MPCDQGLFKPPYQGIFLLPLDGSNQDWKNDPSTFQDIKEGLFSDAHLGGGVLFSTGAKAETPSNRCLLGQCLLHAAVQLVLTFGRLGGDSLSCWKEPGSSI